jgi:3-dehydroquinate synthase
LNIEPLSPRKVSRGNLKAGTRQVEADVQKLPNPVHLLPAVQRIALEKLVSTEGIRLARLPSGIDVSITRIDHTSVSQTAKPLAMVIDELASDGTGHFIVDRGFLAAQPHLRKVLPASRMSIFGGGEEHKTLREVERLIDEAYKSGVHRRESLIAVGGGVTCDVVGLAANLYFRGIATRYVPTTLLAMVDAAIGGKVAVNHPLQKNLIGSFYHPSQVIISTQAACTQLDRDFYGGFGEIVKLALVDDAQLLKLVSSPPPEIRENRRWLDRVVWRCVETKLRLLGENCFERSLSRELNFGHSIAHPLEDVTKFALSHGEAVSIGIAVAAVVAKRREFISESDVYSILRLLETYRLPTQCPPEAAAELPTHLERLKLQRGGMTLHYVIPTSVGRVQVVDDVTPLEIIQALRELKNYSHPSRSSSTLARSS